MTSTLFVGRLLLGATASVLVVASASAADLALRGSIAAPPAVSWSGAYVGGQVGYAWGRDRTTEFVSSTGAFTGFEWKYGLNSVVGGGFAGANYQIGNFVYGLEGDIEYANARGGFYDPPGAGVIVLNWQGSARGRLGYAFDRYMIYGTAGLTFAEISQTYTDVSRNVPETFKSVRGGWTVGVGMEYAFWNNLLLRAEYRYSSYPAYRVASQTSFPGLTGEQQPNFSTVRAGIAYKF